MFNGILLEEYRIQIEAFIKKINVVGAAFIKDGKLLITKRNDDRILGDLWEFPGGKIEPRETPQQALVREISEEMNVEAIVGPQIATVGTHEYDFGQINLTVFFAKLISEDFSLIAHSDIRWITTDEIKGISWADADVPIAKEIEKTYIKSIKF